MTSATHVDEPADPSSTQGRTEGGSPTIDSNATHATEASRHRIPLRWRDLDNQGHVYHAEYLTLADEGRTRWLGDVLGLQDPQNYVVVHISIDYLAEIRRSSVSEVEFTAYVERLGNTSVRTRETLSVDEETGAGAIVAWITCVFLLWDPEARKPRQLTDSERAALGPERDEPSRVAQEPDLADGVGR